MKWFIKSSGIVIEVAPIAGVIAIVVLIVLLIVAIGARRLRGRGLESFLTVIVVTIVVPEARIIVFTRSRAMTGLLQGQDQR